MTQQRDIERLLDHWFGDGPGQASDRVIDIVTDRIERQSQRPAWRLHWRPIPVNTSMKIAVAAATVLAVAILGYNLLPGRSTGVGGPPPSPTGAFGGTVHFKDNGTPVTTEIDAVARGATVTGTAVSTFPQGIHTVRLACVARDGDTWAVAGTVEQSTLPGETPGLWSVVAVKDGSPKRILLWLSGDTALGDCPGFLASLDIAHLSPENFVPVDSGAFVAPGDPAH
jgi:hypothetical protein